MNKITRNAQNATFRKKLHFLKSKGYQITYVYMRPGFNPI